THDDRCQEDGTCRGTAYSCTPGACQRSTCDGAGGCNISAVTPCCGNSSCESGEDCSSCPGDCGSCCPATTCGDGVCRGCAGEDCWTCCRDCGGCGCGDGRCHRPGTGWTRGRHCLLPPCGDGAGGP